MVKNVLFLCGKNRLRSPTAEQSFSSRADLEVASAGLNNDADNPCTPELVEWADIIFVLEAVSERIKDEIGVGRPGQIVIRRGCNTGRAHDVEPDHPAAA